MKKLYFLIASTLLTTGLFAQKTAGENVLPSNYDMVNYLLGDAKDVTDTLGASVLEGCDLSPILLGTNQGGWVIGGNGYGDLEKAQFIETEGNGSIYSALAWIGAKDGGTNETFSAKIYAGDVTDGPGAELGISDAVSYADLDTTGLYTTFTFNTPLAYDASFFVSFEVANGDALYGIVHTDDACGGNSAWELWSDDSWNAVDGAWGDLDVIIYTFVEVESTIVGLDDTNLIERGSQKIYPNPANESANLVFSLIQPSEITVRIYSTTGVLVDTYNPGVKNTGLSNIVIDTQSMSQGLYIYSIETENGVRNGNFSVVR